MARPTREAIETYMSITGASETLASQKLEEYGGSLREAVNAYFREVERNIMNPTSTVSPQHNFVDMNNQIQTRQPGLFPLLSAARSFKPSLLLDPGYRRNLLNQIVGSAFTGRAPSGEVMGFPVESTGGSELPHASRLRAAEDVPRTSSHHGSEVNSNIVRDNEPHTYGDNLEEEMIQAVLEASKKDVEDLSGLGPSQRQLHQEDEELARAISLSLKTAEIEKAMREQTEENQFHQPGVYDSRGRSDETKLSKWKPGSSSQHDEVEDMKHQQPIGFKPDSNAGSHHPHIEKLQHSSEWGGLSSKELDEAVMLENALFGEIPGSTSYHLPHASHQRGGPDRRVDHSLQSVPCPLSPSLVERRKLQEKQDSEYLASLLADREKEINASKEAESHLLKEEVSKKMMLDREELKSWLAMKEASLPQEPQLEDENAVTLLVRMPDGSRRGRRFLKSDKLQYLFDFIDVGRTLMPGTYRVIRPYPLRAFSVGDSALSLKELGLTAKQEALFIELI